MSFIKVPILIMALLILICEIDAHNKYSKEANKKSDDKVEKVTFKTLDKPFRMSKINILWSKAQHRLSEPKLKSLYSELKLHDKEEVLWKRLTAEGKDKDGLKEAQLRKRLLTIMDMYGLLEHYEEGRIRRKEHGSFNEVSDDYINKSLFKDKKLNKLWSKAETAGFTSAELSALKEEFLHHQDKIDQYYSILSDVKDKGREDDRHENSVDLKLEKFNSLVDEDTEETPKKDYLHKVNSLRDQHQNIKDGYDRLQRLTAKGPNSKDFIEPKVQGLWKIAVESDFTAEELESLRIELLHYENRLLKLRHLHAEAALNEEKHQSKMDADGSKPNGMMLLQDNIKKQARKVEKLHLDLETRIMQKHIEL